MVDCEDALPDTLFDQCIRAFIEHHRKIEIKFTLPVHICHALADTFRKIKRNDFVTETDCARFYSLFDLPHVVITRIDFSDLPVSDAIVRSIMMKYKRYLNEINISRCNNLTQVTMLTINTFFSLPLGQADAVASTSEDELENNNLSARSLILGDRVDIQLSRKRPIGFIDDIDSPKKLLIPPDKRIKLKTLVVNYSEFKEFYPPIEYSSFFTPNTYATMKYLDLSQAKIGSGHQLRDFKSLEVLILYDCKMNLNEVLPTICTFKTLRKLDISKRARSLEKPAIPNAYPDSDETHLEILITSLPRLTMLDITGTDLMKGKTANITAFASRISNPFQFLGVFRTRNFGAFRSGLPAIDVAGEANGTHLLTACKYYMNRPVQLKKALKELTIFYRSIAPTGAMNEPSQIFRVIFPIIDLHLNDEKIMLFATHMIYCVIKLNLPSRIFCNRERQLINRAALDVIQRYSENKDILFNCFFPLAIFPEIVYEYLRVSSVALKMCRDNDDRTQSWGVILLNTLACQIESEQKENIGKLNAIPIVLSVIFSKLEQNICDEVLETAWSFIWNITDEAPDNCASFNENKGLDAFERCQDQFGDNNGRYTSIWLHLLDTSLETSDYFVNLSILKLSLAQLHGSFGQCCRSTSPPTLSSQRQVH